MLINLVGKFKEVLKIQDNFFLLSITQEQVINAIKNVIDKEIIQLKKINQDIQKDNQNYKLNLSQFYFLNYSSKSNDVNMDLLRMYLKTNKIVKNIEKEDISNRDVVFNVINNINLEEINKDRIEKFIYEFEQIVQVFNLDESSNLDLLEERKKEVFNQYVDSFIKNNCKVDKYISI